MVAQHFIMTVNITLCALQTDSDVFFKQYENVLKLLLQLQEHCYAGRKESLDISTPLAFMGDSLSAGQFKVTCRCMQQLLHCIDLDTVNIAAQRTPHARIMRTAC